MIAHAFKLVRGDRRSRPTDAPARRPRSRDGLSRLDVLVVLVLFVLFLGLFIVFLGRQREQSQRVLCMNNLKLLAEGVRSFHETQKKPGAGGFFPPARVAEGYATWPVLIAANIGEAELARWDLTKPFLEQDDKVRRIAVPLFFCPARSRDAYVGPDGALGDYAAAAGDGDPAHDWTGPDANGSLILGEVLERDGQRIIRWRGRVGLADLKRGQSNTLLLGEKHVPSMAHGQVEFGDGAFNDGRFPANASRAGGPNHPLAQSPAEPFRQNFGSSHVGRCQFAAADGSVRGLDNSMSPVLLGKLILRD
jgi:hypothetical protein